MAIVMDKNRFGYSLIMSNIVLWRFLFLLILVITVFRIPDSFSEEVVTAAKVEEKKLFEHKQNKDKECGPRSLLVICELLGVGTNLEELCRLSGMNETGTTMYGLYQAARQKGLGAIGMQMDMEELVKIESPGIAFVKGNHFLVVEKCVEDGIRVIDPPNTCYLITKEEFTKIWDGKILLVSRLDKEKAQDIQSPDIIFVEYNYDFGEVEQGEVVNHVYEFVNAGKKELNIQDVQTSCGCTAALLLNKNIPPDGTGEVEVNLDTKGIRGRITKTITVHSNDLEEPKVLLSMTGIVKQDIVLSPTQIYFGDIKRGEKVSKKLQIIDEKLDVSRVDTIPSPYIMTHITKVQNEKEKRFEIEVALSPEIPLGLMEGKLIVYTNSKKRPMIEIPIVVHVKGDIKITPSQIFFGFVKKVEKSERKIEITTNGEKELKIEKVENKLNFLTTQVLYKEEDKKYELTALLKSDIPVGTIKGSIGIHTNDPLQPVIDIPVYGMVRE